MESVDTRIPEGQLREIDGLVDEGFYPNRSEAIRAAVRLLVEHEREKRGLRPRIGGQP